MFETSACVTYAETPAFARRDRWWPPKSFMARRRSDVEVAHWTGPLTAIEGRRVLLLADVENLSCSARDLGFRLSYGTLGQTLRRASESCHLHAFFSRRPGDDRRVRYFASRGWVPHPWDIQTVRVQGEIKAMANSDNQMLFFGGVLFNGSDANVIVVASGDGSLACDLARAVAIIDPGRTVVTMSLAGSTSRRLDAQANPDIAANIEIGRDCLATPIGGDRLRRPPKTTTGQLDRLTSSGNYVGVREA